MNVIKFQCRPKKTVYKQSYLTELTIIMSDITDSFPFFLNTSWSYNFDGLFCYLCSLIFILFTYIYLRNFPVVLHPNVLSVYLGFLGKYFS